MEGNRTVIMRVHVRMHTISIAALAAVVQYSPKAVWLATIQLVTLVVHDSPSIDK